MGVLLINTVLLIVMIIVAIVLCVISVIVGFNLGVAHRKKKVLAPGEMEQVIITKDSLKDCPDLEKIVICTEEE